MLFSSSLFLFAFLPATLFIYFMLLRNTKKIKNYFLLFASLVFYAWGEPRFILMLLLSIFLNWRFALILDKNRDSKFKSKIYISLMIVCNLTILVIFKYLGFVVTNINSLFSTSIPVPLIPLPIGISFFTFQAISYVIDVYRKQGEVQKNILNVGLYLAFFPQLIAGPIVRYQTVCDEINNRKENIEDFTKGVYRFIFGLAKKVLISNQMAIIADMAFDNGPTSVLFAWLGAICYSLQIYFDFSGYSDMAIGLGRMFGFHFDENFNYPYIAKSITDFWRRWHISLSTWFRDYVYIPLGGSRVSKKSRAFFNIFVVWFLTGIWHGASWNFILWGIYFFVLLIIEKTLLGDKLKSLDKLSVLKKILIHIYTLFAVIIGWVLFRATTLNEVLIYLKSMFGLNNLPLVDTSFALSIKDKAIYSIAGIIFSMPIHKYLRKIVDKNRIVSAIISPIFVMIIFVLSIAFLVKGTYNPFIYFNF